MILNILSIVFVLVGILLLVVSLRTTFMFDLAHNLGRKIIAEGVSKEEAYDLLEISDRDAVQGSYICAPLGIVELVDWLAQNQVADISKVR